MGATYRKKGRRSLTSRRAIPLLWLPACDSPLPEVASSRVRNHGGFYRGLEQSPRVSNRWRSSGGVETNELPLAPRDATRTRVSALRGRAHGQGFHQLGRRVPPPGATRGTDLFPIPMISSGRQSAIRRTRRNPGRSKSRSKANATGISRARMTDEADAAREAQAGVIYSLG